MTTAEILDRPELSCYYGPVSDRIPLREAHNRGILWFIVHVNHIWLPIGESSNRGMFRTLEEAVTLYKQTPHGEVHAIAGPFGFPEMLILTSWWNPYNL